ncbi:hypothetical protein D3C85_1887950 [compost metagenome]
MQEISLVRDGRKLDCFEVGDLLNDGNMVLAISRQGFFDHVAFEFRDESEGER